MKSIDAIAKIDFAKEFSFDATAAGKVKAGFIAGSDLMALSASIDDELKTACSGLAKDLGGSGDAKTGTEACDAAVKAMADLKTKMGAKASIAVDVQPPVCSVSVDAVADCAGKCDASVKGGKADVKCEGGDLSGKCDADCSGKCELPAASTCSGTCDGTCDVTFSGTCGGACEGTCDGKNFKGSCGGKCEGKCDAAAKGTCGGKCGGTCELSGSAKCEGTCSGKCSVDFKEPKCSGKVVPPKMSADCQTSCDAHASANLVCSKPSVGVKITGSADAEAAARYKTALEANLPQIVKVAVGMGAKVEGLVVSGKALIEGALAAGQAVVKARPTASVHVGQCLLEPFKGAIGAVGSIQASVKVSIDVKASASASGSASGSEAAKTAG